jgi:superfamily II DNA or RNA helicase
MNKAKDADLAYRAARLWLPKKHVNVGAVKGSLTFQPKTGGKLLAYEETDDHLLVPRHYVPVEELADLEFKVEHDAPPAFPRLPTWIKPTFSLRTSAEGVNQVAAWKALVEGGDGGLVLKCGGGKTVIAIHAAIAVGYPTVFVVNNGSVMGQWRDRIIEHTTATNDDIGQIGDGEMDWEGKPFVLATIQTLWQRVEAGTLPEELRWRFGTWVYDEAHHMAAEKFNLGADLGHGVRWWLTATPDRTDGLETLYQGHLGPVLYRDLEQDIKPDVFFIKTGGRLSAEQEAASKDTKGQFNVGRFYDALLLDPERDKIIAHWVNLGLQDDRHVMLLTPSRKHLAELEKLWDGPGVRVVHGDVPSSKRSAMVDESELLISIDDLGIEALDKPSLSVVALSCPMKNRNNLQQVLGREQRPFPGKKKPIMLVFVDENVPISAKWARRMQSVLTSWNIPFRICDP